MKNLFLTLSFSFGIIALGFSQQTAEVKKATPAVSIQSTDKATAEAGDEKTAKACCKGKSSKDCCKGKKGDAKACANSKEAANAVAPHSCAGHGAKATDATGAKPACCTGKKDAAACSHHGHGHEHGEGMKKEEAK